MEGRLPHEAAIEGWPQLLFQLIEEYQYCPSQARCLVECYWTGWKTQLTPSFSTRRAAFAGAGPVQTSLQLCASSWNSHANGTPFTMSTLLIMRRHWTVWTNRAPGNCWDTMVYQRRSPASLETPTVEWLAEWSVVNSWQTPFNSSKHRGETRMPAVPSCSYQPLTGCWRHPQPRGEMEFSGLLGPMFMTWTLQMTWLSSPVPSDRCKRRPTRLWIIQPVLVWGPTGIRARYSRTTQQSVQPP